MSNDEAAYHAAAASKLVITPCLFGIGPLPLAVTPRYPNGEASNKDARAKCTIFIHAIVNPDIRTRKLDVMERRNYIRPYCDADMLKAWAHDENDAPQQASRPFGVFTCTMLAYSVHGDIKVI